MQLNSIFRLAVIISTIAVVSTESQIQKPEWKGKIEYENGIKVIKNPREPLYGEITLELEEDLSIGNEEDENYMFYDRITLAVDSEGNILVLDGNNCRIQKFDKNGNYLQTIGRKGQGPGEFEQPALIFLDSKDNIYVSEFGGIRRMIHMFDANGNFRNAFRPSKYSGLQFRAFKEGTIIGLVHSIISEDRTQDIILLGLDGKKVKTIARFPIRLPPRIKGHMLGNPYSPRLFFGVLNEGLGFYAYASEYKIFIVGSSGEITYIIGKNEPSKPITKKEKDDRIEGYLERQKKRSFGQRLTKSDVKKAIIFPEFKPFYLGILSDDKGRIYVRRFRLLSDKEKEENIDLFNKEGYYLYRIKAPFFPSIIKDGYGYRLESDPETGHRKIKRYKIKNWDEIKEGIK